jgi:hypothetical protein
MGLQGAKLASALQKARSFAAGQRAQVGPIEENCADGGSFSFEGDVNESSGAFSLTLTYDACRENDEQINGTTTATGTFSPRARHLHHHAGRRDGRSKRRTTAMFHPAMDVYAKHRHVSTVKGSCGGRRINTFNTTISANGRSSKDLSTSSPSPTQPERRRC